MGSGNVASRAPYPSRAHKVQGAAIIAAAEERTLVGVAAAGERLSKEEGRNAERERRRRERKDRERVEKTGW